MSAIAAGGDDLSMWHHWHLKVWSSALALTVASLGLPVIAQDAPSPASDAETPGATAAETEPESQPDNTAALAAEAEQLLRQGMSLLEAGNAATALPLLEQSLARYNLIGDGRGLASAALGVGYAYAELGETARAIAVFESLSEIAREVGLADLAAVTAEALADLRAADSVAEPATAAAPAVTEPPATATQPEPATAPAPAAETTLEPEPDAAALFASAVALGRQQEFSIALTQFQAALAQLEATDGDRRLAARALNGIGEAYRNLNQLERAETYYQRSLSLARELEDPIVAGIALHNLGSARADAGDPAAAVDYYEQALARFRAAERPPLAQQALVNLAAAYRQLDQPEAAIAPLEAALAIARELDNRPAAVAILQALAELHQALDRSEEAAAYQQQAWERREAPTPTVPGE